MSGDPMAGQAQLARMKAYLERDPDNWTLRAEVFDAALTAGDREEARRQLEHALEARPRDAGWRHREAMLLLAQGAHAQAQIALEALLAEGNDAPAVRTNLGYALFAQGKWTEAREAVSQLLHAPGEAGSAAATVWLRCQHRLALLEEGVEAFRRLKSQRPISPDEWGAASLMALDAGQIAEAREWSERALQGRGDQLEALATRATLLLADQDARGAAEGFERSLRVNAGDGRSWSGLAFARMLGGDVRGALQAFGKAVSAIPEHIGTWIGFGWCHLLANDPRAARQTLERALEVDRNIGEVHGALAVALARLGDAARAGAEIEVALRLDPASLSARYAQAVLSGEADDPTAFLRFARKVLSQHPAPAGITGARTMADVVFPNGRSDPRGRAG